ncbi:MAG: NmrA family NAD(P)-binding protein, partial [Burkholderiales bacterium]|nr:NmrA family NAD(P)-binding protein [Burkholderiales bacterium]
RAVTRDVNSDKARALAAAGAEVVAADVDDAKSLERAFAGAYGAYCVTFYWAHFTPQKELDEARSMAGAAKAAGLQHVIWSTLEDTRKIVPADAMPTLMGKYKVPHFDAKGEADRFFRDAGVPTTFLYASYYWDNLIHFGAGPQKGADGVLQFTLPTANAKMAGVAAEDIGRVAYGIFKAGTRYVGQKVGAAGEHLTGAQMAAALTRALGREVRHNAMTPEAYRALGFPGADDLGNMFQFYRDYEAPLNALRDVARSRALNSALLSFDAWLAKHKDRIPIA